MCLDEGGFEVLPNNVAGIRRHVDRWQHFNDATDHREGPVRIVYLAHCPLLLDGECRRSSIHSDQVWGRSRKTASSILKVTTPVRTFPSPLGCLYIVGDRVHVITSVTPDTKTVERIMGIGSGMDRATHWSAISVAGSAGFSQSVTTSVGSGVEVVIRKDHDLVGAEVIARVKPLGKAVAVLKVLEKQVR